MFKQAALFLLIWFSLNSVSFEEETLAKSRKRRFLVFPEGSTFSYAFCLTIAAPNPPSAGQLVQAFGVAVSYDLPNNTRALGVQPFLGKKRPKPVPVVARSHRSVFYNKAEAIMSEFGLEGRPCMLRAVCEGAQQLYPGLGLIPELLRTLLLFPGEDMNDEEPVEHLTYIEAYRAGVSNRNCPDLYPECPFSLVSILINLRPSRNKSYGS